MSKPFDLSTAIIKSTESVTKQWTRQRKAEERAASATANRDARLCREPRSITIRDAALEVMAEAYRKASDNGKLPARPRQIMYAARPKILAMIDEGSFDDQYFCQTLLTEYMDKYDCENWDIAWDARGHFVEPHTGREVPIGTLEVRQYLGERPGHDKAAAIALAGSTLYPTKGPENRYRTVLFVEKEGFGPLLERAQIAERYDLSLMSTKGMSVTAARLLLDRLVERGVERVLILHDFDITGFSIAGTLTTDSRRYVFDNHVHVIDVGLRLSDVEELGLQSEGVFVRKGGLRGRAGTLLRHGATEAEVRFLTEPPLHSFAHGRRVELNAMTSGEFIDFLERKLAEHGVEKVIPDDEIVFQQARRAMERKLTAQKLDEWRTEIARKAAEFTIPADLHNLVAAELQSDPTIPWDVAVVRAIANVIGGDRA
jgi:hypothetical protein